MDHSQRSASPTHSPTASPWPTILRYGFFGGLFLIGYNIASFTLGFGMPSAGLELFLASFILPLFFDFILGILATRHHRNRELGGYMSFGRAVLVGTGVLFLSSVIVHFGTDLYWNLAGGDLEDQYLVELEQLLVERGTYWEQVWEHLEELQAQPAEEEAPKGLWEKIKEVLFPFQLSAVVSALLAMLVGVFVSKSPPLARGD
ncbi:MAG: DUF4199 domain-containing protein [Bacteroidota bacterium]